MSDTVGVDRMAEIVEARLPFPSQARELSDLKDVKDVKDARDEAEAEGEVSRLVARYSWDKKHVSATGLVTVDAMSILGIAQMTRALTADIHLLLSNSLVSSQKGDIARIASQGKTLHTMALARLKEIASENRSLDEKVASWTWTQLRQNLHACYTAPFVAALREFGLAIDAYSQSTRSRNRRQLEQAGLRDEKVINRVIDQGQTDQVLQRMMSEDSDAVQSSLSDIKDRHLAIASLEREVEQIQHMFQDLAVIVDLQQDSLDNIDVRLQNTVHLVDKGYDNISKGEEEQKKERKCVCYIIIIVTVCLVVLLAPIITQAASSS